MKDKFISVIKHPLVDVIFGCLALFVAYSCIEASFCIVDRIYDNDLVEAASQGTAYFLGLEIASFLTFKGVCCLIDAFKKFKYYRK